MILLFAALADRAQLLRADSYTARKESFTALEKNKKNIEVQNQLLETRILEKTKE